MSSTDISIRRPRLVNCTECGKEMMANIQLLRETVVVCAKCRCSVCGIVLSASVCRCGLAHGMPSEIKEICERCYRLMEIGALSVPWPSVASPQPQLQESSGFDADEENFDEEEEDLLQESTVV